MEKYNLKIEGKYFMYFLSELYGKYIKYDFTIQINFYKNNIKFHLMNKKHKINCNYELTAMSTDIILKNSISTTDDDILFTKTMSNTEFSELCVKFHNYCKNNYIFSYSENEIFIKEELQK